MIAAFDIETIPDMSKLHLLPTPEASKTLKDPAKIEADIAEKKQKQIDKMGLDPLTARVFCYAFANDRYVHANILSDLNDDTEREMVQGIMKVLGKEDMRLVTFNGIGFDLPFVYKRAIVLGVSPANFGAPPLSAWIKKYSNDVHYDLMVAWFGSIPEKGNNLERLSGSLLGEHKSEIDFADFPDLVKTDEGRDKIKAYCAKDTMLTWALFERMLAGGMFA
jgi:predicted PolB exonuclease-like 3'-5' exonuclease